ncbi:carbohydrate ABC transporter permease [Cryobacterium sp. Y57]|jgi:multiple sugar transport system permease protein|uniref:carbohydrate ABC transporter permease n=1 Tax=Cryobacterium sp. Y57 TaxID=2048287 RepID=UPI000CE4B0A0|nr:sugar ABC transporter permease [Cryobacterium sp. Y57]
MSLTKLRKPQNDDVTAAALLAPRSQRRSVITRRGRIGWAFVAPFGVTFIALLVIPLLYAFWLSLNTNTLAKGNQFTWFHNYGQAFTDPLFLEGARFVIVFSLILIPFQMLISLITALIIDELANKVARISRLLIFIPYAVPVVIGAIMWGFLYSPSFGPMGEIFGFFGLNAPNLLSADGIFWGLVNIVTWQWVGYYMIIIFSALQGLDPSLFEAARIDGASKLQIALRIKIPLVAPALVLILVFALIGTLQFFTEPQILRSLAGGAITSGFTPNLYAFNLAFVYRDFNYASTISFALGIVVFIGSYIFLSASRKKSGL